MNRWNMNVVNEGWSTAIPNKEIICNMRKLSNATSGETHEWLQNEESESLL